MINPVRRARKEARRRALRAHRYALMRRYGATTGEAVYKAERAGALDKGLAKELKALPPKVGSPRYLPCFQTTGDEHRRRRAERKINAST